MRSIQDLLDEEAELANTGRAKSRERDKIHVEIVLRRGDSPPHCWGEDDCSTNMLSMCPWRIDCGN